MDKYAIYTYSFTDAPVEGDWTKGNEVTRPESSDEHRRAMLDQLFGRQNTLFTMKKQNKSDADDYPCTVLGHPERFVLLRIERPKTEKIFEKHESQRGEAARIDERYLPSYIYMLSLTAVKGVAARWLSVLIVALGAVPTRWPSWFRKM